MGSGMIKWLYYIGAVAFVVCFGLSMAIGVHDVIFGWISIASLSILLFVILVWLIYYLKKRLDMKKHARRRLDIEKTE